MLQNRKLCFVGLSTIWENKGACADQYIGVDSLYLLSILAHIYNVIIDFGVGEPVH